MMESGLKSLSGFSSATNSTSSLMMARSPFPQPPLLPLPLPAHHGPSPSRKPAAAASAPIVVAASPSMKRPGSGQQGEEVPAGWTSMDYSMYSVSPPPSSVPMPTSLLLAAAAGRKKASCAVEVAAGACGGVDVGATDELRRLLRL